MGRIIADKFLFICYFFVAWKIITILAKVKFYLQQYYIQKYIILTCEFVLFLRLNSFPSKRVYMRKELEQQWKEDC